jgi:hypothetical protein
VAGIALDADISAAQIANATKAETVTLTNKTIDADNNTLSNIEVDNIKGTAIAATIGSTPTDTKLATERAVADYAVKQTANANKVYGTNGSGAATEYTAASTYTSTAEGQLLTRAGAYNMYTTLKSCANHDTQSVTISMTALENDFVYARTQWARQIASNVYVVCFEMYRNATSTAGEEVRVTAGKNFKVNGSNVAMASFSCISVYDSSAVGCTYNSGTFFFNPTKNVGSGSTNLFRVTGIAYTV